MHMNVPLVIAQVTDYHIGPKFLPIHQHIKIIDLDDRLIHFSRRIYNGAGEPNLFHGYWIVCILNVSIF